MDINFLSELIVFICALIGFIYGLIKFAGMNKMPFPQIVVFSIGCVACGRLYTVVQGFIGNDLTDRFQLGILGVIGSLLFMFSANFAAADTIEDKESKKIGKYRLTAAAAPLIALLFYVISTILVPKTTLELITGAGLTLLVMQTSYFNLLHLLLSDIDNGLLNSLKSYNILALIYAFLCMAQHFALTLKNETAVLISGILIGALMLLIIPAAEIGVRKWKA